MKIEINQTTLIDQVEDSLLTYFKKNDLRRGDSIPNENNLAAELGVARSVVREQDKKRSLVQHIRRLFPNIASITCPPHIKQIPLLHYCFLL